MPDKTTDVQAAQACSPALPQIDYTNLPIKFAGGMRRYIEDRIEPGSFLGAVLRNDLRGAMMRTDRCILTDPIDVVDWLNDQAPAACWGSAQAVDEWLKGTHR